MMWTPESESTTAVRDVRAVGRRIRAHGIPLPRAGEHTLRELANAQRIRRLLEALLHLASAPSLVA